MHWLGRRDSCSLAADRLTRIWPELTALAGVPRSDPTDGAVERIPAAPVRVNCSARQAGWW